jgi:hypothetical protein
LERAKTTEPSGYITKLFDDTGVENSIQMAFIKTINYESWKKYKYHHY